MSEQTCATCASLKEQVARLTKDRDDERKWRLSQQQTLDDWRRQIRRLQADADALRAALTEIVRLNSRRDDADVQQATRDAATAFAQSVKIARAALASGSRTPELLHGGPTEYDTTRAKS